MKQLIASALLSAVVAAAATALPAAARTEHWQPTWISSPQPLWGEDWVLPLGMPRRFRDVTLRQSVRTALGGNRVRLVISNEYGATPLEVGALAVRRATNGPAVSVRFQGRDTVTVAPGARVTSDAVPLPLSAGDRLQTELYLPETTAVAGFHWNAQDTLSVLPGNAIDRGEVEPAKTFTTRAFIAEILVAADRAPQTVVAIGDSITDGNGSTVGRDQRWPDHLARRLAPRGVAVLNAGIAGNRLQRGGWGDSALARFQRDVLRHPGVRAVVVLLGTNDIGFPGSPFAPDEAPASLETLTDAFHQLVEQAHARDVRVIAATVPPFEHALEGTPLQGHYSPQKEALRQKLNAWIRTAGAFDAIVDFDAVLRDPSHPSRLDPALDSGDHLHPGDAGYRRMAEAID
ncbi:SGNH/GDSL hydrolase family protein [Paracidovorax cattleyae]|uniref:Lysophospholipase L1 n=2 Tax=Paracidovorax cattleyae TaxID=80868 RepID=A0A1H0R2A2_9BURK|nr:SGNH/GDSL hydrolase family protein [Paracidovorax cattleyae]AVS74783.1 SGNH/GDSL hydrolase family protein [Paracidovorax cattleyae]SDP23661.1 Lysophospholipase L1 [Paracidovorax cattleyae]